MEITEVRVFPVNEDKLKAFVSIVIDNCFIISDMKIIQGNNGLFISMPSKKKRNGGFRDIAHPLNNETRQQLEETVFQAYRDKVSIDEEGEYLPNGNVSPVDSDDLYPEVDNIEDKIVY